MLSGELFTDTLNAIRFNLGTHKKTRLKNAGLARSSSLLHDDVSKKHAESLAAELTKRAKRVGRTANERFRLMTALGAVVDPNEDEVREAVEAMEANFNWTVGQTYPWSRGAIELEMVNLTILKKISTLSENEARKLNVLTELTPLEELGDLLIHGSRSVTRVLVHCHVVLDLGANHEEAEGELRKRIKRLGCWQGRYQLEIKGLF